MKVKSFTTRQFDRLKKYKVDENIRYFESELYITKIKENYNYKDYIIKILKILSADYLANKLATVSMLGDYGPNLGLPELVIPEHQILIDNQISGFSVPFVDGTNFGLILKDYDVPNKEKLEYFSKIGWALNQIQEHSPYAFPGGLSFHIGDLHPFNIMITKDGEVRFVDLDSAYLGGRLPNPSLYLSTSNELLKNTNKYPVISTPAIVLNVPNNNSDLYCYNMMILEFLAREKIRKLSVEDYYGYLDYLYALGYGTDLLNSFYKLPICVNNENPYNHLDQIPIDKIGRSSYNVYQYVKNKKTA